jgi:polyribonucleotide nucleotidyltransferase
MMVEGEMKEISEEEMIEAIKFAHEEINSILSAGDDRAIRVTEHAH